MEDHTTPRRCNQCQKEYPLTPEYFVRDKRGRDGFMAICKPCRNANKKAWNEANPEKVRVMKQRDREKHPERIKLQQQRWHENNQEHLKQYRQAYYAENREEIIAKNLQYQRDNPERVNAKNRQWYHANPDRIKAIRKRRNKASLRRSSAKWCRNNPEKRRELGRRWYWNNREKAIAKVQRRRAVSGSYTAQEIRDLYDWQGGICFYCGADLSNGYHADHYIAISLGGTNDIHNIVLACEPCNLSKSNKLPWLFDQRCM